MVLLCIRHISDAVLSVLVVLYWLLLHIRCLTCPSRSQAESLLPADIFRTRSSSQRSNSSDNIAETTSTSCYADYFILVIIFMRGIGGDECNGGDECTGGDECNGGDDLLFNAALNYYGCK